MLKVESLGTRLALRHVALWIMVTMRAVLNLHIVDNGNDSLSTNVSLLTNRH